MNAIGTPGGIPANSGDLYEQAVVKPVLSLSKGRPRDFFAGILHIYSASPGSREMGVREMGVRHSHSQTPCREGGSKVRGSSARVGSFEEGRRNEAAPGPSFPSRGRLGYTLASSQFPVVSSQLEIGVNQRSSAVKHQLPVLRSWLPVLRCGLRPSDCRASLAMTCCRAALALV
jgi:hypothetical protein